MFGATLTLGAVADAPRPFVSLPAASSSGGKCPCVLFTQLCLSPCDPGTVPVRLLCPRGFPGKTTGEGCCFLLQGVFPTQGWSPGLLRCGQVLAQCAPGRRVGRMKPAGGEEAGCGRRGLLPLLLQAFPPPALSSRGMEIKSGFAGPQVASG